MTLLELWDYTLNRENLERHIYTSNDKEVKIENNAITLGLHDVGIYNGKDGIDAHYNDYTVESATKTGEYVLVILKEE